jgi:hypothetical protein
MIGMTAFAVIMTIITKAWYLEWKCNSFAIRRSREP